MEKTSSGMPKIKSKLTLLIVELGKASMERRMAADPAEIAEKMGLPLQWCEYYVQHFRGVFDGQAKEKKGHGQQRQRTRR